MVNCSPRERFLRYLEAQGRRLTRERAIIVDVVFASCEPFDPEQLVAKLAQRTEGNRVSRSTVYRALTDLEKAGLLRKIDPTKDYGAYEHD